MRAIAALRLRLVADALPVHGNCQTSCIALSMYTQQIALHFQILLPLRSGLILFNYLFEYIFLIRMQLAGIFHVGQ